MVADFERQESERGFQAIDFNMTWAREFAEQSWHQSKIALIGFWNVSKKLAEDFEKQSLAARQCATGLAERTLLNSLDFGGKCLLVKEPGEFIRLQSDFITQQAQAFSEQTIELGYETRQAAQQAMLAVYDKALESARRREGEPSPKPDQSPKRQRA